MTIENNPTTQHYKILAEAICRFSNEIYAHGATPILQKAFLDSLSTGQIFSKFKVLEILTDYSLRFESAIFIGQWNGLLPYLLHLENIFQKAEGIEISDLWALISSRVNCDWHWQSIVGDACEKRVWLNKKTDLVINTATEHMSYKWLDCVEKDTHVLIQSTDYEIDEHVNRVATLDDLIKSTHLSKIIITAEQNFGWYKRFTIFGIK